MKKFLKYALLLSVSLVTFASCEDPDTEEKLPYYYEPLAYIDQAESSMTAIHCPLGIFNKSELTMPVNVKLTKPVSNAVKVKLALEVEGEGIDPNIFAFDDEVTIPAGSISADQAVTITDWSFATSIQEAADWKIRFSIAQVTGIASAQEQNKIEFDLHKKEFTKIRPITSQEELVGFPVADQSGWTSNIGNSIFNGGSYVSLTSSQNAEMLVDMGKEYTFAGITLTAYFYAYRQIEVWTSTDGVVYDKVGDANYSNMYYDNGEYYPPIGIAFFEPITVRYLKLVITPYSTSSSYRRVYSLNIMQTENIPIVYTPSYDLNGKIILAPDGSAVGSVTGGTIQAMTNTPTDGGYTVSLTQDDSLIDAYNAANGTSYKALPAENVSITGVPATIEPNAYKSSDITIGLTGDLTKFNDENGYLIPLRLEAAGLSTAPIGGVAYVKVAVEHNNILANATGPVGTEVSDYSGWTATATTQNNYDMSDYLFNNNLWDNQANYVYKEYDTIEIDCGQEINVRSIRLCTMFAYYASSYRLNSFKIELSTNGTTWSSMGVANATEHLHLESNDGYQTAVLIVPTKARYIRLSEISGTYYYYYSLVEVDVYTE